MNRFQALKQKWNRINLAFPAYFWNKVKVGNIGACWPWQGVIGGNGYGQCRRKNKVLLSHRVAYELIFGSIAPGKMVCHHCDNKPCCNPFHLFEGSGSDNQQDCISKGRKKTFKGSTNGMAKLNAEQVIQIRTKYFTGAYTQKALADQFGVTQGLITAIITRRIWNHVTE